MVSTCTHDARPPPPCITQLSFSVYLFVGLVWKYSATQSCYHCLRGTRCAGQFSLFLPYKIWDFALSLFCFAVLWFGRALICFSSFFFFYAPSFSRCFFFSFGIFLF